MLDERPDLETHVVRGTEHAVVIVRGEIDIANVARFGAALDDAADGSRHVDIDMRDTTFMDSSGLAVLIAVHQRLAAANGSLVLRDPPPVILRVLDVSGLRAVFDVRSDGDAVPEGDRRKPGATATGPAPSPGAEVQ